MKEFLDRNNIIKVGAYIFAVTLTTFGLVQVLDYFKVDHPFKNGYTFTFFLLTILSLAGFIYYFSENRSKQTTVISALHKELEELLKNGQYQTILRRRENFSRSLWVEGKPNERIRLGKIAEEAAARLKDKKTQMGILIDDLGWTSVTMGKYKEAISYINHGMQLAEELKDYYWISKGYRHLAGIEMEARKYDNAKTEMEKALKSAKKIPDNNLKNEMLAGIYYGMSLMSLSNDELKKAKDYVDKSEELRLIVGDVSRIVKIYSLKGKIAEIQGNVRRAKDYYLEGLEEAKKNGRTDELIRNQLGLARIYELEGNKEFANQYLDKSQKLLLETPIPYKIDEREIKLKQLRK